jgi:Tfp pilus assembly protein PilF
MGAFAGHPTTDLAMQLLREGKTEECLECLERVVSAYPDNALAYTIMAAAYHKAGDKAMTVAALEHALAEEETARAHVNLAKAYEMVGRDKDAATQYQIAAEMDPSYQPAAEALQRLSAAT